MDVLETWKPGPDAELDDAPTLFGAISDAYRDRSRTLEKETSA